MTHWILRALDRPGAGPTRAAQYDAHKAYLSGDLPVRILVSGPLVDADKQPIGSFFLIEAPDRAAVDRFHAADPFKAADIWISVEIHAFLKRQDTR